jgi:hypothetical protein
MNPDATGAPAVGWRPWVASMKIDPVLLVPFHALQPLSKVDPTTGRHKPCTKSRVFKLVKIQRTVSAYAWPGAQNRVQYLFQKSLASVAALESVGFWSDCPKAGYKDGEVLYRVGSI